MLATHRHLRNTLDAFHWHCSRKILERLSHQQRVQEQSWHASFVWNHEKPEIETGQRLDTYWEGKPANTAMNWVWGGGKRRQDRPQKIWQTMFMKDLYRWVWRGQQWRELPTSANDGEILAHLLPCSTSTQCCFAKVSFPVTTQSINQSINHLFAWKK